MNVLEVKKFFIADSFMNEDKIRFALKREKDYNIIERYPAFINATLNHQTYGNKKFILYSPESRKKMSTVFGVVYAIKGNIKVIRTFDSIYGYSGGFINTISHYDLCYRGITKATRIYFDTIQDFLSFDYTLGETEKVFVYYANLQNKLNDITKTRFKEVNFHKDFLNIFANGFKRDIDIQ